jgi:hypothetical protein
MIGCTLAGFLRWLITRRPSRPVFQTQHAWLQVIQPSELLHLERLGEELPRLLPMFEGVQLERHNASNRPKWSEIGTSRLHDLVLEWCSEDFDVLNYAKA